jgi:hypothetical protein
MKKITKPLVYFLINIIFFGIPVFLSIDVHEMDFDKAFGYSFFILLICARLSRLDVLEDEFKEEISDLKNKIK